MAKAKVAGKKSTLIKGKIDASKLELYAELKIRLTLRRAELVAMDSDLMRNSNPEVLDSAAQAEADRAEDMRLRNIEQQAAELRHIDRALNRMNIGTYGQCTRCQEAIEEKRLRAQPYSQECLGCAEAIAEEKKNAGARR